MSFLEKVESRAQARITRRKFLRAAGALALGAAAGGIGGWAYATKIEPGWVDIVKINLRLRNLHPAFAGFRLAQISDIHISASLTGEQLLDVSRQILELQPDIVAITGDFVDRRGDLPNYLAELTSGLRPLSERLPVMAVLGNHDYTVGAARIREVLAEANIQELPNQVMSLERGEGVLHFAGLDDVWRGKPRMQAVLDQLPKHGAAVLLAHAPDYADISAGTGRFDLQISGHSHGGQVVIPLVGPPVLPRFGEKYFSGLYKVRGMYQYTNRGLGTSGPHVRFNCRPEITLFTLQPDEKTTG